MACLAGLMFAAGCAPLDISKRVTSADVIRRHLPDETYTVDPPDSIRVEFLDEAQMTRDVRVRTDGYITLPLVGEVHVGGLTPTQIETKLEELYSKYYKEPDLFVTVTGFNSKFVFVYGEVGRQGLVAYTGSQTLRDVIASVGGVSRYAAWSRVKVIRGDPDNPEVFKVNLDALLLGGDTRRDVSLAENDVVYVPPTYFAWVGYQIQSLLFPARGVTSLVATPAAMSGAAAGAGQ
jgi:polysaccharide export outer membrane protein